MQRARRPLPDHHQRHEGRSPGARLRRWPPRADLAAALRLRPGPAAGSWSARRPVATCGSAAAGCHLLNPGAVSGSAGSPVGRLPRGVFDAPSPSPCSLSQGAASTHFPGGWLRAPTPSFPLSVLGRSVCYPQRLGAGRAPDSPGCGEGAPGAVLGTLSGWPRKGARGLSLEGKPPFPSLAFRSTWRDPNKLGIHYAVSKPVRVCMPSLGASPGRGAEVPRAALQGPLLALAEAPSLKARLGPHRQL